MSEDSRFDHWVSKLRVKMTSSIRTMDEAFLLMVILSDMYDGLSYLQTFKPKIIKYEGKSFLQATLKQSYDLIYGLNFPFTVTEAYISNGGMGFKRLSGTQSGDLFLFPTPFRVPSLTKTKIIVRFDEVDPRHYNFIPFAIVSVILKDKIRTELDSLPEQRIKWDNHDFYIDLKTSPFASVTADTKDDIPHPKIGKPITVWSLKEIWWKNSN